ncbi:MAG: DUF3373 family protein [bacterium]|nr:DUF3373 family protein [bacterium]
MKGKGAVLFAAILVAALALPQGVLAADDDVQKKLDALSKQVQDLQQQVAQSKDGKKSTSDWLTIGGDYRFRVDSLKAQVPAYQQFTGPSSMPVAVAAHDVKDDSLYTNRLGLNLKAKVMQNVTFNSRLLMYKNFGSQTGEATLGNYFADRSQLMDGTAGHVPGDGQLTVDQAYVTISNILGQPIWFSVGRRPSTGGLPTHIRQNGEKPGVGGVAGLLVDYAYDGMVFGYAPDIDALPGAYAKLCYGRGYQEKIHSNAAASVKNMDMLGVVLVPYDTDPLTVYFQANHAMNIIDNPNNASVNLGEINQYGLTVMGTQKMGGNTRINLFASGALDQSRPNGNTYGGMPVGLMYTGTKEDKTGNAVYLGARLDLPSKTKIGFEYNHGSRNWIAFIPAADDIWTSKLGTRGNVYEGYLIQELPGLPIASYTAKTFIRVGYQYYDFQYTGSNSWVGGPEKISEISATNPFDAQMFAPVKNAQDLYATLEVKF